MAISRLIHQCNTGSFHPGTRSCRRRYSSVCPAHTSSYFGLGIGLLSNSRQWVRPPLFQENIVSRHPHTLCKHCIKRALTDTNLIPELSNAAMVNPTADPGRVSPLLVAACCPNRCWIRRSSPFLSIARGGRSLRQSTNQTQYVRRAEQNVRMFVATIHGRANECNRFSSLHVFPHFCVFVCTFSTVAKESEGRQGPQWWPGSLSAGCPGLASPSHLGWLARPIPMLALLRRLAGFQAGSCSGRSVSCRSHEPTQCLLPVGGTRL